MKFKPLTTGEVAKYCNVTNRAVLKWITSGKMKAYRTPGRQSRVEIEDFMSFLAEYKMPIPGKFLDIGTEKKKVLIVDDDRGFVRFVQEVLSKDGKYEVREAYDGFSTGLIVNEFRPDLMTLDIRMPMLDGLEVCKNIRSNPEYHQMKILVITAVEDEEMKQKMLDLGADDYLVKPLSGVLFLEKVGHLLEVEAQVG